MHVIDKVTHETILQLYKPTGPIQTRGLLQNDQNYLENHYISQ